MSSEVDDENDWEPIINNMHRSSTGGSLVMKNGLYFYEINQPMSHFSLSKVTFARDISLHLIDEDGFNSTYSIAANTIATPLPRRNRLAQNRSGLSPIYSPCIRRNTIETDQNANEEIEDAF